jgi:serine/threonine protein kinase
LIGKGSFGSVYKAFWRDNVVAVKVLSGVPDKSPLVEVKIFSLSSYRSTFFTNFLSYIVVGQILVTR